MKIIIKILILLVLIVQFNSCKEEELGTSIFNTTDTELDPASYTYKFDKFLYNSFLKPYNLEFAYKLIDVETDMDFNLVPASFENSKKLAVLAKYLWFDVYSAVVDTNFLRIYGPRMIHLIGSPAYNPANGTMILGLAEGGIKISLFMVNNINTSDPDMLNEYYFKTMHHEFAHILHQTKPYPKEYNLISYKNYDPYTWQDRDDKIAASLGFASPYGSSAVREDFVEIIANYIVKTDADWNNLLNEASKGWKTDPLSGKIVEDLDTTYIDTLVNGKIEKLMKLRNIDNDGVNGKEVILRKHTICKTWLKEAWNIDLELLRSTVQYRQSHIDMPALLSQIK